MKLLQVSCFTLLLLLTPCAVAEAETQVINQFEQPSILERAFLRSLGESVILKVMVSHGDIQLYFAPRIEKIVHNDTEDFYDISLRVIGFAFHK